MDTAGQSTLTAEAGGEGRGCGGEGREGLCVGSVDRENVSSPSPSTKQRSLRAVYVLNDGLKAVLATSPESGALQCLQRACDAESALLTTVTFGRLDFGETSVLDTFYDADIAVVDMSDVFRQPSLFYHLGVRESFDMANNVILYHDTDPDTALSLKDMVAQKNTVSRTQTLGFPWVQLPPEYRGSGLCNKVGTAAKHAGSPPLEYHSAQSFRQPCTLTMNSNPACPGVCVAWLTSAAPWWVCGLTDLRCPLVGVWPD